jgi:hypothetical protein
LIQSSFSSNLSVSLYLSPYLSPYLSLSLSLSLSGAVDLFQKDLSTARRTVSSAKGKLTGTTKKYREMFAKDLIDKVQERLREDYAKARRQG